MQPKLRVVIVVVKVVARRCWRSFAASVASACDPEPATASALAVRAAARPLFTGHVVGAGVLAGGLMAAASFMQSEPARVLELAAGLAVALVATSAVLCVVGRHRHSVWKPETRLLLVEIAAKVAPLHGDVPGARVLILACSPSSLLNTRPFAPRTTDLALSALRKRLLQRVIKVVPVLGSGLDLIGAYRTAIKSMGFVSGLERAVAAGCSACV
jgi:hypothetical protein